MTNEELKDIIARHVCNACEFGYGFDGKCDIGNDYRKCSICGETAEALIEAGIGDVEEAEHRAKVAEKALKNAVDDYVGLECTCKGVYDSHFDRDEECEGCELRRFEMEDAIPCAVNKYLNYAEKELAEEEEK